MKRSVHRQPVTLLVIVAAMVAGVGWFFAPVLLAHANLARAEPSPNSVLSQSPGGITIWFTEPIEAGFSAIQVLDTQGQQVDRGDSVVDTKDPTSLVVTLPPLPNGTYTVAWKNVSSVDGHTVRGSFVFSVGEPLAVTPLPPEPTEQPLLQSPLEPVFRWLILLSALALVGGLGFELLITRPVLDRSGASEDRQRLSQQLGRRTAKLIWLAIALLLVASVGQLIIQTSVAHDIPLNKTLGRPVADILSGTGWGHLWLWRVGLLLAVAGILSLGSFLQSGAPERLGAVATHGGLPLSRLARVLALGIGAGLLLTLSLTSHGAATKEIRAAAVFADYLHLLAAGFWVGGLFHLALGVPLFLRNLSPAERRAALSALVPRFSTVASLSVGTLIITGLYSAWAQVTILSAVDTPYGVTLLVKVGLVAPLLWLGALNLLWVRPRLVGDDRAGRWLRRFVAGEAVLALLVLLSVGVLTSLEPARQVASREKTEAASGLSFQGMAEGTQITLDIVPGKVGVNRLLVSLKDGLGNPITNATDVSLSLTYLSADLGENTASATSVGEGRYGLEQALLSIAGPWQVGVLVQRPDAFDARTAFRFQVTPGGAASSAAIVPAPDTGRLLLVVELALLGSLFLAVALPLGGWWTRQGAVITGTGGASVLAALFLLSSSLMAGNATPQAMGNPFPPNPESLEVGRQIYQQDCQSCHGEKGRGDGPLAAGLNPPPFDLTVHVPLHPDRELFNFIHDGIPRTAMVPWGGNLTSEEIWHLINYIKTLE